MPTLQEDARDYNDGRHIGHNCPPGSLPRKSRVRQLRLSWWRKVLLATLRLHLGEQKNQHRGRRCIVEFLKFVAVCACACWFAAILRALLFDRDGEDGIVRDVEDVDDLWRDVGGEA